MDKNSELKLALVIVSTLLIFTVACQKNTVAVDEGLKSERQGNAYQTSPIDNWETSESSWANGPGTSDDNDDVVLRKNIFFDFDKATLTSESQDILAINSQWLRTNPDVMITIEGHCDERGTNGYNLALGDRRAEAVKTFLVDLGIHRSRMTTISYGEERPFAKGRSEAAWAKNRRAHFSIK